jgi:dienelactone hydrolase
MATILDAEIAARRTNPPQGPLHEQGNAMHVEEIEYEADDRRMVGTFAIDDYTRGLRPAVLLSHEGPGLDNHVKGRAIRLASLGYAAFALDYQGGGVAPPLDEGMARLGELIGDSARVRALGQAGLDVLLRQERVDAARVAAMGFCFGGAMSLDLARAGADLEAVIGFHPGFGVPNAADARNIRGRVLMFCGADDSLVPKAARDAFEAEMIEAGVAGWRIEVLGGVGHSFTNINVDDVGMPGLTYDARADRDSWAAAVRLLEETIG